MTTIINGFEKISDKEHDIKREHTIPWIFYNNKLILGKKGEHHLDLFRRIIMDPKTQKVHNNKEAEEAKHIIDDSIMKIYKDNCFGRYNPEENIAFFYHYKGSSDNIQKNIFEAFLKEHEGFLFFAY